MTSRWAETDDGLEVFVTTSGMEEHGIAMELRLCLGQAPRGRLSSDELRAHWTLLEQEASDGITGEIDEQALEEKRPSTCSPAGSLPTTAIVCSPSAAPAWPDPDTSPTEFGVATCTIRAAVMPPLAQGR